MFIRVPSIRSSEQAAPIQEGQMKIRVFFGWGGLTALLLLGGNALWIAHAAHVPAQAGAEALTAGWVAVLACLALVSVLTGYLANGRAIGIFIDDRNRLQPRQAAEAAGGCLIMPGIRPERGFPGKNGR